MSSVSFDEVIDRRNTGARKWDAVEDVFGVKDVLPFWIADMDFAAPAAIKKAVQDKADHGIYGYYAVRPSFYEAVQHWVDTRHGWKIDAKWLLIAPGVVPSISFAIQALTVPGDEIIIQTPVYPPFFSAISLNHRRIVENPLRYVNGRYEMDFADLEKKITANTKLFLLCSPHNPVGRVWTKEELQVLGELCLRHNITILADEIHSDLIFSGHKHLPLAALSEALNQQTVTFISPSKTFNIAGLYTSLIIAADQEKRAAIYNMMEVLGLGKGNLFGVAGTEAAYREGNLWLDGLLAYLEQNADYTVSYIREHIPSVKLNKPEGTYLAWLDFRELFQDAGQLRKFLIHQALVGLNDGATFGKQGAGFARLNFACPRSQLTEGLRRIRTAVDSL